MSESEEILVGMEAIRRFVGGVSPPTVLKWHREYEDFPIAKQSGQWVAIRADLVSWYRNFIIADQRRRRR